MVSLAFGLVGLVCGLLADRISVRWPEHDEEFVAGRPVGWRTVVVAGFGALGLGVLPGRFEAGFGAVVQSSAVLTLQPGQLDTLQPTRLDPAFELVIFAAYVLVLTLLLATDLDQRLLPDALTLPMIPLALVFAASGRNPMVGDALLPAIVAAVVIPAALYLPSLRFGPGAFGMGDVKLLVTIGLVSGAYRALLGLTAGVLASGVVIVALLALRRTTRKSYIPFGPFLILGALWAILLHT